MKAISIYQPYAAFIAMGLKTIETRTHDRFRCLEGQRIAIHVAKKKTNISPSIYNYFLEAQKKDPAISEAILFMDDTRGKIICTVTVARTRWWTYSNYKEKLNNLALCEIAGKFLLFLEDIEPINPVPFRGRQGIFNVPDELIYNPEGRTLNGEPTT